MRVSPELRIVRKDRSWFCRAVDVALKVVTLGAQRKFLTGYQTTIGRTLYVTPDWDELPETQRQVLLRHERVHAEQFRRYTFLGMSIAYLLLPLPLGLAWCRARLEKEAYAETIRAADEAYGREYVVGPLRAHVVAQFVTGAYGWMWPFRRSIERWYDGIVRELA